MLETTYAHLLKDHLVGDCGGSDCETPGGEG